MNLYVRYFEHETLVHSADEVVDFLYSLPAINMNESIESDVRDYISSDVPYPKRYKVNRTSYFIIIKTTAESMRDFKDKKALRTTQAGQADKGTMSHREMVANAMNRLAEMVPGWYEADLNFKRVVTNPVSGKHEYRDTHFVAQLKANSGQDCYDRVIDYLRTRVDGRSQFPSIKGKNFRYKYLGKWK